MEKDDGATNDVTTKKVMGADDSTDNDGNGVSGGKPVVADRMEMSEVNAVSTEKATLWDTFLENNSSIKDVFDKKWNVNTVTKGKELFRKGDSCWIEDTSGKCCCHWYKTQS
jgi:hypothetical protein